MPVCSGDVPSAGEGERGGEEKKEREGEGERDIVKARLQKSKAAAIIDSRQMSLSTSVACAVPG